MRSGDGAVVVGVDGTGVSESAAEWAAGEAAAFGLTLVLVHAVRRSARLQAYPYVMTTAHIPMVSYAPVDSGGDESMRRIRDMLDGLADRCRRVAPVDVHTGVATGDPADAVLNASDRPVFVVVGHSAGGGLPGVLLGSTADRLRRSCPWPVVVIREGIATGARRRDGPVVVGVDGSAVSRRAIEFAFAFASRHAAEVVVVHASGVDDVASSDPVETDTVETDTVAALRERRGPVGAQLTRSAKRYPEVRSRMLHVPGPPAEVLLAASADAAVIVVGSHGKGSVRRALLGSVSHAVVNNAPCPVAVLPPETTDPTGG